MSLKHKSLMMPKDLVDTIEYRAAQNSRSFSGEVCHLLRMILRINRDVEIEQFKVLVSGPRGD